MKKTVLTFGLISGALAVGTMLSTLPFLNSHDFGKADTLGYASMVMPGLGEKVEECMVERARTGGASAEKIEEAAQQAKMFKTMFDNPLTNVALTFAESFPIGLVASALSAAILRKK